ncbi:hypothetical protein Bca4012_097040 [Brassica carinata]
MSIVVDVNRVSDICESSSRRTRDESVFEKLKKAAGHIEELYKLIAEEQNILGHFDEVPFCETPLHVAAENGKTHFAMELLTLKPSLALKLNVSGFSPTREWIARTDGTYFQRNRIKPAAFVFPWINKKP